ncbi:hypothetical protein Gotur_029690, partial [Gossypium turneri]
MEQLVSSRYYLLLTFIFIIMYVLSLVPIVKSGDAEALLALKSTIDPFNSLQWQSSTNLCSWQGVKECKDGRVTKLVLEHLNLTGSLNGTSLNLLDQLRVLSFKGNSISGQIPNLSGLVNLKIIYLDNNKFNGEFPESLPGLHRLKIIVLSGNQINGEIPFSLLKLKRLYTLYLQNNELKGPIPPLNQTSLRFFNVSNNQLYGQIPVTPSLVRFNTSSFLGNAGLCGEQVKKPCPGTGTEPGLPSLNRKSNKKTKLIIIVVAASVGVVEAEGVEAGDGGNGSGDGGSGGGGGFWESEGVGSLVFVGAGDQQLSYSLEDLLKASAETLGRGTMGSTYKAVMESGFIVTVKRLKDARYPRSEEFRRHVELIGRLGHPNLVPLRAYFQAKEE